jgi:hypothetical protein
MHISAMIADLLRGGTSVRFRASGLSMGKAIRSGEVIEVEPIEVRQLRLGDIVLCERQASLVAHRLLAVVDLPGRGVHLILRGDGLAQCDLPVPATAVLGRVTRVTRDLPALVSSIGRVVQKTYEAFSRS